MPLRFKKFQNIINLLFGQKIDFWDSVHSVVTDLIKLKLSRRLFGDLYIERSVEHPSFGALATRPLPEP